MMLNYKINNVLTRHETSGSIQISNFVLNENNCHFSCLKIETDYDLFLDKFEFLSN